MKEAQTTTSRIFLRRIEPELDAEIFFKLIFQDEKAKKFFKLGYSESLEETQDFLTQISNESIYTSREICDEKGRIIGIIFAERSTKRFADISFFIGKKYRKKGYCIQALIMFEQELVNNTKIKIIRFIIANNNPDSKKVMRAFKLKPSYIGDYLFYTKRIK